MAAKHLPVLRNGQLTLITSATDASSSIVIDTPAWRRWIEQPASTGFSIEIPNGSITVRREQLPQGRYWYAYHRKAGKRHKRYIGTDAALTDARIQQLITEFSSSASTAHTRQLQLRLASATPYVEHDKQRRVLTPLQLACVSYLALTRQPQRREQLRTLLWPDGSASAASHRLRTLLWELRQIFGPRLHTKHGIALDASMDVDVWAIYDAQAVLGTGPAAPDQVQRWRAAVLEYHAPLLHSASISRSEEFDLWLTIEAEQLHQAWLRLVLAIGSYDQLHADWERLAAIVGHALRVDPLQEPVYHLAFAAALAQGDRATARRWYQQLTVALAQIGLDPDAQSQQWQQRIQQRSGADSEAALAQSPSAGAAPSAGTAIRAMLPPLFVPLIERERELAQLLEASMRHRLVSVVGPGGVGKTRLALEALQQQREHALHSVIWLSLAEYTSVCEVASALLHLLTESPAQTASDTYLQHLLHNQELLLGLDNAEHLPELATWLHQMLSACPLLRVIVTSRTALGLHYETTLTLQPLAIDTQSSDHLKKQQHSSATRFFMRRLQMLLPSRTLDAKALQHCEEIARLLEGLPLALEITAGLAKTMTLSEIVCRLQANDLRLHQSSILQGERHSSLEQLVNWSYRHIDPAAQATIRVWSVCQGSWPLRLGQMLLHELTGPDTCVDAVLQTLVQHHLLIAETKHGQPWYRMYRPIQSTIQTQWGQTSEVQTFMQHYAESVVDYLHNRTLDQRSPGSQAEIMQLWPDIQHAWRWLEQQQQFELLARSVVHIAPTLERQHQREDAVHWLRTLLPTIASLPDCLAAQIYEQLATTYDWRNLDDPTIFAKHALEFYNQLGAPAAQARVWTVIGGINWQRGNTAQARHAFQQSLALCAQQHDLDGVARAWNNLGIIDGVQKHFAAAQHAFETSLQIYQQFGHDQRVGTALGNLGLVAFFQDDWETAAIYFGETEAIAEHTQFAALQATAHQNWAILLHAQGDWDAAWERTWQLIQVAYQQRIITRVLEGIELCAWLLTDAGSWVHAGFLLLAATAMRQRYGYQRLGDDFPIPYPTVQRSIEQQLKPAQLTILTMRANTITYTQLYEQLEQLFTL